MYNRLVAVILVMVSIFGAYVNRTVDITQAQGSTIARPTRQTTFPLQRPTRASHRAGRVGTQYGGGARAAVWGRSCPGCATYPTIAAKDLVAVEAWANGGVGLREDGVLMQIGNEIPRFPLYAAAAHRTLASISLQNYDVVKVAASLNHAIFLRSDGSIGGFGDNTHLQISTPTEALCECIVDVAAGMHFSMMLRDDGTVFAWGSYYPIEGALPVAVNTNVTTALVTNAVKIGAGNATMYALKNDGTMQFWGRSPGVLAEATLGSLTDVVDFDVSPYNSGIAIKADGTVVGWGSSSYFYADVAPDTAFSTTNAVAASVGLSYGMILRDDGTIVTYGNPDNTYKQRNVPAALQHAFAVAAGDSIAIALNTEPVVNAISDSVPTSGAEVIVSGQYLSGITKVYLDRVGTPLPFRATPYQLTIRLPRHAHGPARLIVVSVTGARTIVPIMYEKVNASSTARPTNTQLSTRTKTPTFTVTRTPTKSLTPSKTPTLTRSLTPTRTRTPCLICPP